MSFIPTLIETIRIRNGVAPLWYLHLRRLSESCRTLGVPFPLKMDVPSGGPDRVVRLEVGPRGMTVSERPLELSPGAGSEAGCRAWGKGFLEKRHHTLRVLRAIYHSELANG